MDEKVDEAHEVGGLKGPKRAQIALSVMGGGSFG